MMYRFSKSYLTSRLKYSFSWSSWELKILSFVNSFYFDSYLLDDIFDLVFCFFLTYIRIYKDVYKDFYFIVFDCSLSVIFHVCYHISYLYKISQHGKKNQISFYKRNFKMYIKIHGCDSFQ